MSPSPTSSPSLQSRLPQSAAQRAQLIEALQWLATTPLDPTTCPTNTVTDIVTNSTSIGKIILSKYDPARLQTAYSLMHTADRIQFVDELRQDLYLRRLKARKCDQILAMIAAFEWDTFADGEGGTLEEWEGLAAACRWALENTELLEERLEWCEENFETGISTLSETTAERRVWGEGRADVGFEGEERRGRSRTRRTRIQAT